MTFIDFASMTVGTSLLQLGFMAIYFWAYRRSIDAVSRRELLIVAPAIVPSFIIAFWAVVMFDYSHSSSWEQALGWTWWLIPMTIVLFLVGYAVARWRLARYQAKRPK